MRPIINQEVKKKYLRLSSDQRELYHERVAVMFFDGDLSYIESEKRALEDVLKYG